MQPSLKRPDSALFIPHTIWNDFFRYDGGLSSLNLLLMQANKEVLLRQNQSVFLLSNHRLKTLLAIAYAHPELSFNELEQLHKQLGLSEKEFFLAIVYIGKVELLNQFDQNQIKEMLCENSFAAFHLAARHGHLHILNRFITLVPNKAQEMLASNDFLAFQHAAENGHLHILNRLIELAPDKIQEMIAARDFMPFQLAAKNGHLNTLEWLLNLSPDNAQKMIRANSFSAFQYAAENGHLHVLNRLIELAPDTVEEMIAADDFIAFRTAAANGHLHVLNRLVELAPDKVQEMMRTTTNSYCSSPYEAFKNAAKNGHLHVLNRLVELAPDTVEEMIAANDFIAFRYAADNGHLQILIRCVELAQNQVEEMVTAFNHHPLEWAKNSGHSEVVHYLLQYASVFTYAEQHDEHYGKKYTDDLHSFMTSQINALRAEKERLNQTHPNEIFNITDNEKVRLCFCMIRNLIKRNEARLFDDIQFLVNIPSVKARLHEADTSGQSNALLRLAQSKRNQAVAELLLTAPAVRALVLRENYYRQSRGRQRGLDLLTLARNVESSMTALTEGEQKRLDAAKKRYSAQVTSETLTQLKEDLKRRYEANPAAITTGDGREIKLPFAWEAWQTLSKTLCDDTKEAALIAYYQHKEHSAYRYLSKPNHWMSPDAEYVHRSSAGNWSSFEEYTSLISLLYLAAKDPSVKPTNGYTLEGRVKHFIDELAHLGRAHNWDKTRIIRNQDGTPKLFDILDSAGSPIEDEQGNRLKATQEEEYDDLEADKPSCCSGIKRRLFQSVQGHPLLDILTKDKIYAELSSFVREHFIQCIQNHPTEALQWYDDWRTVCDTGLGSEKLSALNLPKTKQDAFILKMAEKYDAQFTADSELKKSIEIRFSITEQIPSHAARFGGGESGLTKLLEQHKASYTPPSAPTPAELRALRIRSFLASDPEDEDTDIEQVHKKAKTEPMTKVNL